MRTSGEPGDSLAEAVVQSSLDGFAVVDRESRYVLWNRAMERFAGKTADEVLGRPALEVFPFLREHGLDLALARALEGESVVTNGVVHIEPDGTRKVYDRLYEPIRSQGGEVTGVLCIVKDATARYAAIDALRASDAKLRMAVEAAGVGFWSWDPETDVAAWESTMCEIFGVQPESAPTTLDGYLAIVHPDDRHRVVERVGGRNVAGAWEDEYRIVRPDGVRWIMSKIGVVHVDGKRLVLGAVVDVTSRRERDDRQRAAQRLEAVGSLTAGIAHNFNNLLMGMLPTLAMAARSAPADIAPLLDIARSSAQDAADLVKQLVTYAGNHRRSVRRPGSIAPVVERTVAFCRTTFDDRIAIELRTEGDAVASFDPSELEQATLNLIINARDAVEATEIAAPKIVVTVGRVTSASEVEGREGDWVRLAVADNGIGMTPDVVERMYEPFFTTKVGKGTGLGLSTTYGIVREHRGFITCRSARGGGSVFTIFLPQSLDMTASVQLPE